MEKDLENRMDSVLDDKIGRIIDESLLVTGESPPRASGNGMIDNDDDSPDIVSVLTIEGMDLVLRSIWLARIYKLESITARTAAMLLLIKLYGGGAMISQETLEKYTGADSIQQIDAVKAMWKSELDSDVCLGILTALVLMDEYGHRKCLRHEHPMYGLDHLDKDKQVKIVAKRAAQHVFSDKLPL